MKKTIIDNLKNVYFETPVKLNIKLDFKENQSAILKMFPIGVKYIFMLIPVVGLINYFMPLINSVLLPDIAKGHDVFSFEYFIDNIFYVFLFSLPFFFYYFFKKGLKNGPGMNGINYLFEKDILTVSTEAVKTEFKLNSIIKVLITDKLIMIFIAKNSANVIPKRVFNNKQELDSFINQFKQ